MVKRKKILIINTPERVDTYSYLDQDKQNDYYILWHEKKNSSKFCAKFIKNQFFWTEFSTPKSIIKKLLPDVIVFFEIMDFRQIALTIVANKLNIKTIFLDHGAAGGVNIYKQNTHKENRAIMKKRFKKISFLKIIPSLKIRFFYLSAIDKVSPSNWIHFIRLFFKLHTSSSALALNKISFEEKNAEKYILFNRNNYNLYNYIYNLDKQIVNYSGIPYFDKLIKENSHQIELDTKVIFIDSPLLESKRYGWTNSFHKSIAHKLFDFATNNKLKLIIKLHPRSNKKRWDSYTFNKHHIKIVQSGNLNFEYQTSKLIISYPSSMVPGFLSMKKNVVVVGWHPTPKIFGVDFSKFGVCHKSLTPNDLSTKYGFWSVNNLAKSNKNEFDSFTKLFNYPPDGNAAYRIIQHINH